MVWRGRCNYVCEGVGVWVFGMDASCKALAINQKVMN